MDLVDFASINHDAAAADSGHVVYMLCTSLAQRHAECFCFGVQDLFSVYVHTHPEYPDYPPEHTFHGRRLPVEQLVEVCNRLTARSGMILLSGNLETPATQLA